MQSTIGEVTTHDGIRLRLEDLPGVHRAVVDGPPYRVLLVCEATAATQPVVAAARAALAEQGVDPDEATIEVSHLASTQPARRVRFLGVEVARPHVGTAVATVRLEWSGTVFEGRAEGEGGMPLELRVCGRAALRALEAAVGGTVDFELIGVKPLRIFDHDLVSVLVHTPASSEGRLIGVSIVAETEHRSTVLAVLNATNRLVGNYLPTTD